MILCGKHCSREGAEEQQLIGDRNIGDFEENGGSSRMTSEGLRCLVTLAQAIKSHVLHYRDVLLGLWHIFRVQVQVFGS